MINKWKLELNIQNKTMITKKYQFEFKTKHK